MVVRGLGRALIGEEIADLATNDLVRIPPLTWHRFQAGTEPFGFICMVDCARDIPERPDTAALEALKPSRPSPGLFGSENRSVEEDQAGKGSDGFPIESFADGGSELVVGKGFLEERRGVVDLGDLRQRLAGLARDEDEWKAGMLGQGESRQIGAVELRHRDVGDDEIELTAGPFDNLDRLTAVARFEHPVPLVLQCSDQNVPQPFFVIHDENGIRAPFR